MADIKSHQRVNDILLGPLERPVLRWLAAHQPAWVNPDLLTGMGVLGAVLIFTGYVFSNYGRGFLWVATLGFFINWYGDSLDGTLARYRQIEKHRYGYFVDHTVDAFNETLIILGLGLSPYVRFDIACLLLISYLLLSILVFLRTSVTGVFQISLGGLGPTEIRLIAVLCNLFMYWFGIPTIQVPLISLSLYNLIVALLAASLFAAFLIETIHQARNLSLLEEDGIPQKHVHPQTTARGWSSKSGETAGTSAMRFTPWKVTKERLRRE